MMNFIPMRYDQELVYWIDPEGGLLTCKMSIDKKKRSAINIETDANTPFIAHTPPNQASCNSRLGSP